MNFRRKNFVSDKNGKGKKIGGIYDEKADCNISDGHYYLEIYLLQAISGNISLEISPGNIKGFMQILLLSKS